MADSEEKLNTPKSESKHQVLARKYRPTDFKSLMGQDALIQTLQNAIRSNRLAHAYVLTGVRGVGKTTTARIIAKALNCVGEDGLGTSPAVDPCGVCEQCVAIAEDRHVDVMEMDAASRTGVDDIRELIDGVRYKPVSGRYKVYIIDEVHMLSKNAFNALLKTLEEPPEHVKFVMATTEIRKVPVTVLSRCQRFDLRRYTTAMLQAHFASIAKQEGIEVEDDALAIIARAADGSARDGLSVLDQAFSLTTGKVDVELIQSMLGLSDRETLFDLFEALLSGQVAAALNLSDRMFELGGDPLLILRDLADLTHWVTRAKITPSIIDEPGLAEAEKTRGGTFAKKLSLQDLARCWQLLLKGIVEVQTAPNPEQAAEMLLIRLAHASTLPSPEDLVKQLQSGSSNAAPSTTSSAPQGNGGGSQGSSQMTSAVGQSGQWQESQQGNTMRLVANPDPVPVVEPQIAQNQGVVLASFEELVALFDREREVIVADHLRRDIHLVHFGKNTISVRLASGAPRNLIAQLSASLKDLTGQTWMVASSDEKGQPTLFEQSATAVEAKRQAVLQHPFIKAAMETFPGAKIAEVRKIPRQLSSEAETDKTED
jgi:DNA polymerase III subunit gamma/tau